MEVKKKKDEYLGPLGVLSIPSRPSLSFVGKLAEGSVLNSIPLCLNGGCCKYNILGTYNRKLLTGYCNIK